MPDAESHALLVAVGVDGSPTSEKALRWAADYARLAGGGLKVICAWHLPTGYGYVPDFAGVDFESQTRQGVEATIARTLGAEPAVPVGIRVAQGHPAAVLVDESRDCDLLVIGSRGLGAFRGMLLGSVSQHCVQHATCPTLIVRGE